MKKGIIIVFLIIASVMFLSPINTKAVSMDSAIYSVSDNVYVLDEVIEVNEGCTGGNDSLLGDPTDEDSVAWLVQKALDIIKVAGPILVVLLSSIDYIRVLVKSDDETMAKAQKKLIIRLILALLLFLIPVLVQVLLQVFGITSDPTCGLQ